MGGPRKIKEKSLLDVESELDLQDSSSAYSAKDIEVLEGLEPVRKRPGMYIGGTDERAYHHLMAEVLDNSMDEVVAGHANRIEVHLDSDGVMTVSDNGRGIPVDPHPKYPDKSALEVIMTTLHAGGKFSDKAYQTAGGLHGVGISVVNALSEFVEVEVARNREVYRQRFERGVPTTELENIGQTVNRRGTTVTFIPDPDIFGDKLQFRPSRIYRMVKSKAYLIRGVELRWSCDKSLLPNDSNVPEKETFKYPNGLADQLVELFKNKPAITEQAFTGLVDAGDEGKVEWAISWTGAGFGEKDGFVSSYCNTVPTPEGGAHETGFRNLVVKGLRTYAELSKQKKGSTITADDVMGHAGLLLSVFIKNPEFVGQTKDRLSSISALRLVESTVRDRFDHWLAASPKEADKLLNWAVERAEERARRRKAREFRRQTATKKLRLPGKLADCTANVKDNTEIFIVEGDSAGGSAKQARDRKTQAILPLRGKILNVMSASGDKLSKNQELADLTLALGTGVGASFDVQDLRYDRVIIMTDADVDGAHIATLLITFFYKMMPHLISSGKLYLAMPPLFRLSHKGHIEYVMDEAEKEHVIKTAFKPNQKIEVSRFKGLGEMNPQQLKETTMNPNTRTLAQVSINDTYSYEETPTTSKELVEILMGKSADARFKYIQEHAEFAEELDI